MKQLCFLENIYDKANGIVVFHKDILYDVIREDGEYLYTKNILWDNEEFRLPKSDLGKKFEYYVRPISEGMLVGLEQIIEEIIGDWLCQLE